MLPNCLLSCACDKTMRNLERSIPCSRIIFVNNSLWPRRVIQWPELHVQVKQGEMPYRPIERTAEESQAMMNSSLQGSPPLRVSVQSSEMILPHALVWIFGGNCCFTTVGWGLLSRKPSIDGQGIGVEKANVLRSVSRRVPTV